MIVPHKIVGKQSMLYTAEMTEKQAVQLVGSFNPYDLDEEELRPLLKGENPQLWDELCGSIEFTPFKEDRSVFITRQSVLESEPTNEQYRPLAYRGEPYFLCVLLGNGSPLRLLNRGRTEKAERKLSHYTPNRFDGLDYLFRSAGAYRTTYVSPIAK